MKESFFGKHSFSIILWITWGCAFVAVNKITEDLLVSATVNAAILGILHILEMVYDSCNECHKISSRILSLSIKNKHKVE